MKDSSATPLSGRAKPAQRHLLVTAAVALVMLGTILASLDAAMAGAQTPVAPGLGTEQAGDSSEEAEASSGGGIDTGLVVAISLSAVALLVAVLALVRRTGREEPQPLTRADDGAWRVPALDAAEEGGRIVEFMMAADNDRPERYLGTRWVGELERRLDLLAEALSRASVSAPTEMDARVTRAVAIRAHALMHAVHAQCLSETVSTPEFAGPQDRLVVTYHQRRQEFAAAVRDLRQHAELF